MFLAVLTGQTLIAYTETHLRTFVRAKNILDNAQLFYGTAISLAPRTSVPFFPYDVGVLYDLYRLATNFNAHTSVVTVPSTCRPFPMANTRRGIRDLRAKA